MGPLPLKIGEYANAQEAETGRAGAGRAGAGRAGGSVTSAASASASASANEGNREIAIRIRNISKKKNNETKVSTKPRIVTLHIPRTSTVQRLASLGGGPPKGVQRGPPIPLGPLGPLGRMPSLGGEGPDGNRTSENGSVSIMATNPYLSIDGGAAGSENNNPHEFSLRLDPNLQNIIPQYSYGQKKLAPLDTEPVELMPLLIPPFWYLYCKKNKCLYDVDTQEKIGQILKNQDILWFDSEVDSERDEGDDEDEGDDGVEMSDKHSSIGKL